MRRRLPALLVAAALALAACGGEEAQTGEGSLPSVSGAAGEKPTIEVPDTEPGTELVVEVQDEGEGPAVAEGDYLVADYLGQTWAPLEEDGEANVFDNSFDRGQPAIFPIGVGKVIDGWDEGLVGQQVGSRVLLVIPPDKGYGAEGSGKTIPADSTLVFVVDLKATVPADAAVSGTAVTDLAPGLATVTDNGAEAPTVSTAGAAAPAASGATVVVSGDGEELKEMLVVNVLQVSLTTGETQFSSWEQGAPALLTPAQLPGLAEALAGQKEGTRVLVQVAAADNPGSDGSAGEPLALVVDVIDSV